MDPKKQLEKPDFGLGFIIAPALAPISFIVLLFALPDTRPLSVAWYTGLAIMLGIPTSYLFALMLGLPYASYMSKKGRLNFKTVMLPIVLFAILPALLIGVTLPTQRTFKQVCSASLLLFVVTGLPIILSGFCFWLVGVLGHSDRTAE